MNFLIISHTNHKQKGNLLFGYAPYVREMNLWLKYVGKVEVVAPKILSPISNIEIAYKHKDLFFNEIPFVSFTSLKNSCISLFKIPIILVTIFRACKRADHIHLRCPGNIGLLGCLVQIFFPKKVKTAKYAGNWDPKAKQPLSYRFQKKVLRNIFFTKNIKVLVYGNWKAQTKNIIPFFTATFHNSEIETPLERNYNNTLHFIFVGSLVKGKQPLLAVKAIEALYTAGNKVQLELYGDGVLKVELQAYILNNNLEGIIILKGNQEKEVLKKALKNAHFLLLPSQSEGWPKVVAEAMFFGTIPIVTKISCVPFMLDYGSRGILIEPTVDNILKAVYAHLKNKDHLKVMSKSASNWSQKYTLDTFETKISKLLNH